MGHEHPPHPQTAPSRPHRADVDLLRLIAAGHSATEASDRTGQTLTVIARRLQALREHYAVSSTTAALRRAHQLGHLDLDLDVDLDWDWDCSPRPPE